MTVFQQTKQIDKYIRNKYRTLHKTAHNHVKYHSLQAATILWCAGVLTGQRNGLTPPGPGGRLTCPGDTLEGQAFAAFTNMATLNEVF